MKSYRRIEINAFRRRVTVVSGAWPRDVVDAQTSETGEGVSLDDTDACEPVAPDSPEGQEILVEAVRSLERRLTPETRAALCIPPGALAPNRSTRNRFCLKLQSFYEFICPKALRIARKEMKMSSINNQNNHARQLLGLTLATAMLTSLFAVTSYSHARSRSSSIVETAGTTSPLTQPQTKLRQPGSGSDSTSPTSRRVSAQGLNRWSSNGPEGGNILSLAIDRGHPATSYAGTASGVFKSSNSGGNWRSSQANTYVLAVTIDPTTSTTVYAAGYGGASKSTDGGQSWSEINNGLVDQYGGRTVNTLAIDPTNPNIIYAGTYGGVFKTTDGGGTWSEIYDGLSRTYVYSLAIDPLNPNTIYAGGVMSGGSGVVLKSTNSGGSWSVSYPISRNGSVSVLALAVDPINPNIIYAGGYLSAFKSTDGAQTWTVLNGGLDAKTIHAFAIDPANENTIYAATSDGVFKSGDRGGSWSSTTSGITKPYVQALVLDPVNTAIAYAGTYGGGIFKSVSGGADWNAANDGLRSVNIGRLAVDPLAANAIYAGTESSGMYKSGNNGGSWSGINNGLPDQSSFPLAVDPLNPGTVYAGIYGSGLYKSTNGGESWSRFSNGLGSADIFALAIEPSDSNVIYAGAGSSGVFKSINGGESWSAIGNLNYPESLVIDPRNATTIYAVSDYYVCFFFDCEWGSTVFKSTDGGVDWTRSDTGTNFYYVAALAIDPINTTTIYVSAYADSGGGIFKSTDGGGSWNAIGTGLPSDASSLVIDPVHPSVIYAGTYSDGVFKSADGGASWNPLNDGLTNLNINTLVIDASGNFLHAGTPAGVFDYQYSAATNPIDDARTFVHQQYLDFLNREPDRNGWDYWTNQITQCGSDAHCIHERRIGVSAAFFIEQEFQDTGYYVDRLYKASFGRQPNFAEFTGDRSSFIGGSNLEASKQAFADEWVQRAAFRDAYPITMSNTEVVNKLFDSAGLTASIYDPQRQQEIQSLNAGRSRALVLRDVIEIPDFKNIPDPNNPRYGEIKQTSQYNPAFVLMQYFGYLRRDGDQPGYDFWLNVLNNREPSNYRGMVCSFITSTEYQLRFGSLVTRSNADCSP